MWGRGAHPLRVAAALPASSELGVFNFGARPPVSDLIGDLRHIKRDGTVSVVDPNITDLTAVA